MRNNEYTHFGYKFVSSKEKTDCVNAVFSSVAHRYDVMNDLMSFGIHRLWKRLLIEKSQVRPTNKILDVAGGTGDLAYAFSKQINRKEPIYLVDINADMLQTGRDRLLNCGITDQIIYIQANAENLPFDANYFDLITIAFGLRNITHQEKALREMYRLLKPGGKLLILEFSKLLFPLFNAVYDIYSFNILPRLGRWITNDEASYHYLVESIRCHPDQEKLKEIILASGFDECEYHNWSTGIVALHCGYKY